MHPLDNPIWNALANSQSRFSEGEGLARRFAPEVTTLAGFREATEEAYASLRDLISQRGGDAGLFLDSAPTTPIPGLAIVQGAPIVQMIHDNTALQLGTPPHEIIELAGTDMPEMLELAKLTQPGPFGPRTNELGTYLGIRKTGRLVAMAGERLSLPGYREISAVCTHPDHLGQKYAGSLMTALMQRIRGRSETCFLHVRQENTRAIELYQRLGFRPRLVFQYRVFRSPTDQG